MLYLAMTFFVLAFFFRHSLASPASP